MTAQEIEGRYVRVSRAAMTLRVDSSAVYRMLQRGVLDGLCHESKWLVETASLERLRTARQAEAARQGIQLAGAA